MVLLRPFRQSWRAHLLSSVIAVMRVIPAWNRITKNNKKNPYNILKNKDYLFICIYKLLSVMCVMWVY